MWKNTENKNHPLKSETNGLTLRRMDPEFCVWGAKIWTNDPQAPGINKDLLNPYLAVVCIYPTLSLNPPLTATFSTDLST